MNAIGYEYVYGVNLHFDRYLRVIDNGLGDNKGHKRVNLIVYRHGLAVAVGRCVLCICGKGIVEENSDTTFAAA